MLYRAHTSKEEAIITRQEIERLIFTKFNDRQVDLLCNIFEDFFY
jgi:hypothetical protein